MADVSTPYSTLKPFMGALPQWLSAEDAARLESYRIYEDIYNNVPDTFKLVFRGSEDKPIYIPSGKQIVNTMNRYTGRGFGFRVDPTMGTPEEQLLAIEAFNALFVRERLLSKFQFNKRFGLIRGDWLFHITADPAKPQGSRLTITPLDPGSYFPLFDPDNLDHILGCDIVEQYTIGDKLYIKRQRYLKSDHPDREGVPGGPISTQLDILEVEGWQSDTPKFFRRDVPPTLLPADIPALPVYHFRNNEEPQNPFGSSEMRGLERLMVAINQATSDEELALAMDGLGMYATDAGAPVDADGNETNWVLGPGRVVEHGTGSKFIRVNGVGTVTPAQDHIHFLIEQLRQTSAIPDIAIGKVDVQAAESGIALALQLGPIIDASDEKDMGIKDTTDHMLHDLRGWLKAYEGINLDNVKVEAGFEQKIPQNREKDFNELQDLFANGVISTKYYREELQRRFGYEFPADMDAQIAREAAAAQAAAAGGGEVITDPDTARLNAEAGVGGFDQSEF